MNYFEDVWIGEDVEIQQLTHVARAIYPEDDFGLSEDRCKEIEYYLSDEFAAPRIFNFHLIQIYANSESYDRYKK